MRENEYLLIPYKRATYRHTQCALVLAEIDLYQGQIARGSRSMLNLLRAASFFLTLDSREKIGNKVINISFLQEILSTYIFSFASS